VTIRRYDESLPPLKNFILPGGNEESAFLHMARTAARRAERRVVPLAREEIVDQVVVKYLNRLSDFLYTAARFVAAADGARETIYCKAR
jgi:ATP:cob(I)alamin adenosyltransferase|tara:strand:- start:236 stop:502 length:267 start_codon:yes stop_codon:yes gene_type:complete